MKKLLSVFAALSLFFVSCSKSDPDEPKPSEKEAIFKVELSHSGDLDKFLEIVNLSAVSTKPNIETLKINGVEWEPTTGQNNYSKVFTYTATPQVSRTFITSQKITSFVFSSAVTALATDATLTTTVKIYVDDKLKENRTITTNGEIKEITIPVEAE